MSFDSLSELKKFKWTEPLNRLCFKCLEKRGNIYTNAILGYNSYFGHLVAIWARYNSELQDYVTCRNQWSDLLPKSSGIHKMSGKEWDLYYAERTLLTLLQLDYESFIIFAKILMDKVCRIARLILDDDDIPTQSFTDHKKFFLKHQNNPYIKNEIYGKLVREETDWYDNCLKSSRDKIIVHSGVPWSGRHMSAEGGIQFTKINILAGANLKDEFDIMLSLKLSYREIYPEINKVSDTLWDIIEFFMIHNVKMKPEDKKKFYKTVHRAGANLPSLQYVANSILQFLKRFAEVFEYYA